MFVNAFRAQPFYTALVDTDWIYEDSVQWAKDRGLNGGHIPLPYRIIKCQIDYSKAEELGLASGLHSHCANRANIFLFKKDNEKDPKCKDGYKYLRTLADKNTR